MSFFNSLDFLFRTDFWVGFYVGARWVGIVLIIVLATVSAYVFLQVWPFLATWNVRAGRQAYLAPRQRYAVEDVAKMAARKKWAEILRRVGEGPAGFSLAIIDADVLLENALGRIGIPGKTIADRLKSLSPDEISNINDVWEAHALRNRIAHESGFVPRQADVTRALAAYKQALEDLEAM